ncbi:MAG: hypothetical protein WBC83_01960 [Minisyncoccia bacterium]
MDHIFEQYKRTGYLHHAHVIEGAYDIVAPAITVAIAKHLGIDAQGNPDFVVQHHESFGVDEARSLKSAQARSGFGSSRKIFVIGTKSFTREAQNALLKTFEEPTAGTHFFIILPRAEALLPTLLSRVLVVSGKIEYEDDAKALAEKFINTSLEERFAMAKKLAEKKIGETVDRELFRRMFDHIERILYTRTADSAGSKSADLTAQPQTLGRGQTSTANIFREIFKAKTYIADRGSSPKMLLEHLAVTL